MRQSEANLIILTIVMKQHEQKQSKKEQSLFLLTFPPKGIQGRISSRKVEVEADAESMEDGFSLARR